MANMEDPLEESYSGLALFQTLGHRHPPSTTDPLAIHSFFKSLPVSDPELVQQARSILETASEAPEITEKPPQEEAEKMELVARPRGRRKGLERKRERPRFSLIPNSNISSVNLESALDLDKLKDPEEFFLAYERLENAKREIAKQTGHVSGDFSQNNGSTMAPRPRREGLPGRSRTPKYQHLYPTVSSQESSEAPEITEKPPQDEAEKMELVASPRGRRKGLERKRERPRFSLIPNSNISSVNLESALDLDKLKDPEEFFLAFERVENAKREIAKQTGRVSGDFSQNNGSTMAPRPRREGLPGFRRSRTPNYQHLYPTVSSQESIEKDILSPSNHGLQKESVNQDVVLREKEVVASQQGEPGNFAAEDMELAGSILQAEGRVDKLLDGLLAHDFDDLDGDGVLNLLQDRLQIKSLEIGKLNLPDIQDVQRIDLKAPGMNVPKPRNVLSDIHNLLKGRRSENPMKQKGTGSFAHSLCSPIPPKSPFASLALLKERLFQSNPSDDPFSTADIDESPARNTSLFENIKKSSNPVDTEKELIISSPLKSIIIEHEITSSKDNIADMTTGGIDQNLVQSDTFADARTTGPNEMEDLVKNMQQDAAGTSQPGPDDIDESLIHLDTDADFQTKGSTGLEDMVRNMEQEAVDSCTENQFEQSDHPLVEDYAMDGCFEIQDDAPQQTKDISPKQIQESVSELHNEKNKEPSVVSKEGQVKAKSQSRKKDELSRRQQKNKEPSVVSIEGQVKVRSQSRKKKELSRRHSLAAAGTTWTSEGVRRSTRIRSRPLEYWRGERFLYGRIHDSLATVIGIKKYMTPKKDRKDGNRDIVVESFVSDKYKNLVKLAALH